jgi:3-oxoacyl-[acyl-carrier-protein] synthase-1
MVNALGADEDTIWEGLLRGEPGSLVEREGLVPDRVLRVGAVETPLPAIPAHLAAYACRNNAMALAALRQIEEPVREAIGACGPVRVGVVMGTSTSGVSDAEAAIAHHRRHGGLTPSFDYAQLEFGGLGSFVAEYLGTRGPAYTLSTACSSGARALASARSLLALGLCDAVVAGAADTLCGLTTNGFSSLQLVCDGVTNPCSRNRAGITLGEGAAVFLVLPSAEGVQLLGVGESSEAHHMSAPDPEGLGARRAMQEALDDAGLAPEDIAYLNLHGTGTPLNDAMECSAVAQVFAAPPPCSSTKSLVGHTLGAAGAMEAGFCWLVLRHRPAEGLALIPHAFDGERDPELAPIPLVGKGLHVPPGPVMSNSFGFGGNNCALILADAG